MGNVHVTDIVLAMSPHIHWSFPVNSTMATLALNNSLTASCSCTVTTNIYTCIYKKISTQLNVNPAHYNHLSFVLFFWLVIYFYSQAKKDDTVQKL